MITAKEAQKLFDDAVEDANNKTEIWINAQLIKIEAEIRSAIKRGGCHTWFLIETQKCSVNVYTEADNIQMGKLLARIKELGYVADFSNTNGVTYRFNINWKKESA